MRRKNKRKEKINLILDTQHYKRMQLYLYFGSVALIVLVYFLVIFLFGVSSKNIIITGGLSVVLGVFLIFYKDHFIKHISDSVQENKVKKVKKDNKEGYQKTMRRITPKKKRNIINVKAPIKEKVQNLKKKFKKKDSKKQEYIEIK